MAAFFVKWHRQRCSRCGRIYLARVGRDFWNKPGQYRAQGLCEVCKLQRRYVETAIIQDAAENGAEPPDDDPETDGDQTRG